MISIEKSRAFWRHFKRAQRGTTAVIFAMMIIPVIAITGGVVDYGRAVKTKAQLQETLDAAVLAAMLQYSLDKTTDFKKVVTNYVEENLTKASKAYHGLAVDIDVPDISENGEMKASLSSKVATFFLGLVGFNEFEVSISSAAMVGGSSLELALVLDNTGSMKGHKLTSLIAAAHDLVDTVMPETDQDNVKISLVPFADYVNIGNTGEKDGSGNPILENRNEPGLDIPADYSFTPPGMNTWEYCPDPEINESCTTETVHDTCYNDGVPYPCSWEERTCNCNVPKVEGSAPYEERHYKWQGCMASRPGDLNVRDEDYDTGVPGVMYDGWDWCSQIAMALPLTSSKSEISSAIDSMKADNRQTYIPAGLVWGWRMLSNEAPFSQGAPYGDDAVKKVIVLMTDGANTRKVRKWTGLESSSQWWLKKLGWRAQNNSGEVWGHGAWDDGSVSNPATAQLCENIKAKNIMIYTIGFEIAADSDIENLMKACAGNGGRYFDADNSAELADAFKEIGQSLLNLRLSQ